MFNRAKIASILGGRFKIINNTIPTAEEGALLFKFAPGF